MVGISGTSKNKKRFYYYYCSSVRKKLGCDKKHVARDWLEDLVVEETLKHILKPGVVQGIAKKIYALQTKQNANNEELDYFKKRLSENKKSITNIIKIIESGAITDSLPVRLNELEKEQKMLKSEIVYLEAKQFTISEEQLVFMLTQYINQDLNAIDYKHKIIKCFVSSVYLYDNKLFIYYNTSDGQELKSSDLSLVESEVFDEKRSHSCIALSSRL